MGYKNGGTLIITLLLADLLSPLGLQAGTLNYGRYGIFLLMGNAGFISPSWPPPPSLQ